VVTIAALIYLLTTPKPIFRAISFMAGIFIAYFIGGILIKFGADKLVMEFFENISFIINILEILIGIILIWLGFRYRKYGKSEELRKPRSLKAVHAFTLGFIVTASDIPTALPYLAAIGRIVQEEPPLVIVILLLVFYIVLYELPLLAITGFFLIKRQRGEVILQKIKQAIGRWSIILTIAFFILLGLFLTADGLLAILGFPLIQ